MKILVTGFTANYGGVENFIMNYYRVMKQLDHSVVIDIMSTAEKPAFHDELEKMGGKVWKIPRNRYKWKQKNVIRSILQSSEEQYDVFWCNKCELADITYLKVAKKCDIKVRILHSHNSNNMYTGFRKYGVQLLHEFNKRNVKRFATDYWACSDYAANWMFMEDIIGTNNYKFVPNAVDIKRFQYNENIRDEYRKKLNVEDKLVIGTVGRFNYQKNPEFILETFREIYKINSNAVLLWIGVGELQDKIKQLVIQYNLENVVFFLGIRQDVNYLMQAMDCFLLPSRFEGLPVVAVESQIAGLPTFISREGISEQVKFTEYIYRLSLKDPIEDWAKCILKNCKVDRKNNYNKDHRFDINMEAKKVLGKMNHLVSNQKK
ncbi:MAG: glycosyltransferase [Eubacteriales bacterium]